MHKMYQLACTWVPLYPDASLTWPDHFLNFLKSLALEYEYEYVSTFSTLLLTCMHKTKPELFVKLNKICCFPISM